MADEHLPDLTERLRIRRRSVRMRRWAPVAVALGVLLLSLVAAWVVRWSPALRASTVEVAPTKWLSTSEVSDAARVPLGTPLAGVDLAAVAHRVALLGPVNHVQVTRKWPHTITIQVTERTAAYQRRTPTGYQWVDADGVVFHTASVPTKGLVTATTSTVDNQVLSGIATVISSLKPGTRAQLVDVQATTPDSIVLDLKQGRTIMWGSADQSDLKAQVAQALLGQHVSVIDVSSPTHPTGR